MQRRQWEWHQVAMAQRREGAQQPPQGPCLTLRLRRRCQSAEQREAVELLDAEETGPAAYSVAAGETAQAPELADAVRQPV